MLLLVKQTLALLRLLKGANSNPGTYFLKPIYFSCNFERKNNCSHFLVKITTKLDRKQYIYQTRTRPWAALHTQLSIKSGKREGFKKQTKNEPPVHFSNSPPPLAQKVSALLFFSLLLNFSL